MRCRTNHEDFLPFLWGIKHSTNVFNYFFSFTIEKFRLYHRIAAYKMLHLNIWVFAFLKNFSSEGNLFTQMVRVFALPSQLSGQMPRFWLRRFFIIKVLQDCRRMRLKQWEFSKRAKFVFLEKIEAFFLEKAFLSNLSKLVCFSKLLVCCRRRSKRFYLLKMPFFTFIVKFICKKLESFQV